MRVQTTLLEIITAVNEAADTEAEATATLLHLMRSGTLRMGAARLVLAESGPRVARVAHVA